MVCAALTDHCADTRHSGIRIETMLFGAQTARAEEACTSDSVQALLVVGAALTEQCVGGWWSPRAWAAGVRAAADLLQLRRCHQSSCPWIDWLPRALLAAAHMLLTAWLPLLRCPVGLSSRLRFASSPACINCLHHAP